MKLNNDVYDALKWTTLIALPGVGTLYFTLSQIWGLPAGEQVVGTISAVAVLLGSLIGISSSNYNSSDESFDGTMQVDTSDPEKDVYSLDLGDQLENLATKDKIVLRVSTHIDPNSSSQ